MNSKWMKDLQVKREIRKYIEDHLGHGLLNNGSRDAQSKNKELRLHQTKKSPHSKINIH